MENAEYIGGKWRITPKARESREFEYKDGDWYPKKKKKQAQQTLFESKPRKKKTMCGSFPLQSIKNILATAGMYIFSSVLGVSLAFNIFLYMQMRNVEQQNLQLIEVINKEINE
jgi:hypothetical protein